MLRDKVCTSSPSGLLESGISMTIALSRGNGLTGIFVRLSQCILEEDDPGDGIEVGGTGAIWLVLGMMGDVRMLYLQPYRRDSKILEEIEKRGGVSKYDGVA